MSQQLETLADYIKARQIGGNHYKTQIQPWDVFLDWEMDPWLCNVIKYVQRHARRTAKKTLRRQSTILSLLSRTTTR